MQGPFVMIPRWLFDSDDWKKRRVFSRAEAWIDLLQMAAFRPFEYQTCIGRDHLERGEVVASLRFLAVRWNWSHTAVRRWLDSVQKAQHLTLQRKGQHGTVYRIVGYDGYVTASPESVPATVPPFGAEALQQRNKEEEVRSKKEEQAPRATAEPAPRILPFPAPGGGQLPSPPLYQPQPRHEGRGRGGRDREPGRGSKDFVEPAVEGAPVGWAIQLAIVWTRVKGHPGPIQDFADLMAPLMAMALERGWGLEGAKKAIADAVEATRDEANVKGRPEIARFLTPRSFAENASYWLDFANRSVAEDIQGTFVS